MASFEEDIHISNETLFLNSAKDIEEPFIVRDNHETTYQTYVQQMETMLSTVLDLEAYLFTDEELNVFQTYRYLPGKFNISYLIFISVLSDNSSFYLPL